MLTNIFGMGLKPPTTEKIGSRRCVFLNSFEDFEDKKLKSFGTDSQLLNPTFPPNFPTTQRPPEKILGFLYMSTGLCLRTSRSQVLALKKEPRIDCALVFFALGKVGGL